MFSPILDIKSVRQSPKDLVFIFKLTKSSLVPSSFIFLFSCIALDRFSANIKKSSFLATKSVSHLILHTVKSVFDELL